MTIEETLTDKYGLLMTPKDVSEVLHQHPNHIRDLCKSGQLPAVQIGNRWRIQTAKLAEMLGYDEIETNNSNVVEHCYKYCPNCGAKLDV